MAHFLGHCIAHCLVHCKANGLVNCMVHYLVHCVAHCLVHWFHSSKVPAWNANEDRELYDLKRDPDMTKNVAGMDEYTETLDRMDRHLRAGWRHTHILQ